MWFGSSRSLILRGLLTVGFGVLLIGCFSCSSRSARSSLASPNSRVAMRIGRRESGAWLLAGVGLLSIAFGTFLLVYPRTGLLAVVWASGLYAIVIGVCGIARAWLLVTTQYA